MEQANTNRTENLTIKYMIEDYCNEHHHTEGALCPECQELIDYAFFRISKCPHGENKPNCADCKIHCYKPEMREKIIGVMRFAGPRMIFKHPMLAARHIAKSVKHKKD